MAVNFGRGIRFGDGVRITGTSAIPSGGGGGGGNTYTPQYTSDPGGSPWPTTQDYGYVTYHDVFGLTIKAMKGTSDIYTFFSTAGIDDTFDVVFSGTTYSFTIGDYNPGTIYTESNGVTDFYTAPLSTVTYTVTPSLSAGEGVTLYGTSLTQPSA